MSGLKMAEVEDECFAFIMKVVYGLDMRKYGNAFTVPTGQFSPMYNSDSSPQIGGTKVVKTANVIMSQFGQEPKQGSIPRTWYSSETGQNADIASLSFFYILLENPSNDLHRRLGFQVSGLNFKVHFISKNNFQCVNVNVLWRGRESLHNNSKHIQYLL
jgi:hypothetical protein